MNKALAKRLSLSAIMITTAVFAVVMAVVYFYERNYLIENARSVSQLKVEHSARLICDRLDVAEVAVINSQHPTAETDFLAINKKILANNPDVSGSAIALTPEFAKKWAGEEQYMTYAYRDAWKKDILTKRLTDAGEYNYADMEWFKVPVAKKTNASPIS